MEVLGIKVSNVAVRHISRLCYSLHACLPNQRAFISDYLYYEA